MKGKGKKAYLSSKHHKNAIFFIKITSFFQKVDIDYEFLNSTPRNNTNY